MYLTPIRAVLGLSIVLAASACGQLTGLSDDYQYDLEGGAASGDSGGAGDGATKPDAPTTTEGGTDSGLDASNKCSPNQAFKTGQKLGTYSGTTVCKSCLATSCCNDVDTCTASADCNHVFSCKLDCTLKSGDKTSCFKSCTLNGGLSPEYQATVGSCAPAACSNPCGLN
jgi:hypothetical protein